MQTVVVCEICGCKESQGHVDPETVDASYALDGYRSQLRAANNTEAIRKRVLAASNGRH